MEPLFIGCTIKQLPVELHQSALMLACDYNPANMPSGVTDPARAAVIATKWWGAKGVNLTVGFPFDSTPLDLQARIVQHMNAWSQWGNIKFNLVNTDPQVRIYRGDTGYWSYLGVDILSIPRNQPTMNLQGFTMNTPESEFHRVVRHECGHTLGMPHEHSRKEIVSRLDPAKTIAYFMQTQGWTEQEIRQQVLTPVPETALIGTPHADQDSIMSYQLPGSITIDGEPIRGGVDIDEMDQAFIAKMYPLTVSPPTPPINPPPPPPPVNPPLPPVVGGGNVWGDVLKIITDLLAHNWIALLTDVQQLITDLTSGQKTIGAERQLSLPALLVALNKLLTDVQAKSWWACVVDVMNIVAILRS